MHIPRILYCYTLFLILFCIFPGTGSAKQGVTENYGPVVAEIIEKGDAALEAYREADGVVTGNRFSRLYFDVFETSGMEFTLGLKDNAFMLQIESGFSLIISQTMRGESRDSVMTSWDGLKKDLRTADEKYSSGEATPSFWGRVVQSFTILFREGVEAMLVVAALIAYLRRSGYGDKVPVIYYGVLGALAASVLGAWALTTLVQAGGAGQEALEGITMLIAACVLVYVSYWLTSKRDADRWQAFIKKKMDAAMGRGSVFALGLVSFLAVFREGAETILFYQALIGGSSGQLNAIWVGMVFAAAGLVVVYLVVRLASIRLPLSLFFTVTAGLMFMMAFVFTGQGILELQVSGMIDTTKLEGWPMLSWLGVFPTLETMIGQIAVLLLLPAGLLFLQWQKNRQNREMGVA